MVAHFLDRESILKEQIANDQLIIMSLAAKTSEAQFELKRISSILCLMKKNSGDNYRSSLVLKREISLLKSKIAEDALVLQRVVSAVANLINTG